MQRERLEVLEQDPALTVHQTLRQTRGARGVENPERMLERELGEFERRGLRCELRPRHPRRGSCRGHVRPQIRKHDRGGDARQMALDLRYLLCPVKVASAVAVAVDGEEDLRIELAKAVDNGARAEVGRAAGPDRAEGGCRE
jgi:hypothetical protein